jgi:hypothetical protein
LRTYRNKHLNIESKRNKHFIKLIIHKEVLKLQKCEIAFLWLHFWSTRSMKTPDQLQKSRLKISFEVLLVLARSLVINSTHVFFIVGYFNLLD